MHAAETLTQPNPTQCNYKNLRPNPTQPNPTQSNPTQPMDWPNPWIDPTHGHVCADLLYCRLHTTHIKHFQFMLIMKSADWLHVARPILLVCISLAEVVITPPPPVILWQVISHSFSYFSSRLQVASQSYFYQFYVTDSGDYFFTFQKRLTLQVFLLFMHNAIMTTAARTSDTLWGSSLVKTKEHTHTQTDYSL